ncbi:PhzF family phenazine biosynthesis protein [Nocardioides mesophilus]|uniref:PhzF family phenazine biosynthesis protein n=1 Tax=Nocardioides mesophilus TaxID=433659 RepID=A0A7G9R812_9ACTN|nr:PhzF family phenazine biosynthesis protein [Nocardioides mesophilus]QNN51737.1 PhzF family phenazine biosynthesis protein [Nocardioides mesophilus]
MHLAYDVVDVFTDRPFAGNQLAVVHGAGGLSTEQCLALTREFGYSESTFPVPGGAADYATRIFTPEAEIPFAGHPTLGTAWVLRDRGELEADEAVQQCGAGPVGVRFWADRVELSATPRDLAGPVGRELAVELLADVGLGADDLDGDAWVAGCGLTFVHLPVRDEALRRARPSASGFERHVDRLSALGEVRDLLDAVNLYAVAGEAPGLQVHSRVFVPGAGVPEDPATGSAAAGLGMALVARGLLGDGGRYTIRQGVEMGRPSTLHGRVEAADGLATRCHVAGQVRHVARGEILVPELS